MFRQYRPIRSGEFIVVGGDPAAGGGDNSVCQFFSKTHNDVPLVFQSEVIATEMTNMIFPVLKRIRDVTGIQPVVGYERQNGGAFEMDRLAAMNIENKYRIFQMPQFGVRDAEQQGPKYGWETNTATRGKMLGDLKELLDKRLIKIYDKPTIEEAFQFIVVKTSYTWRAQAQSGAHDDLLFGLGIAWEIQSYVHEIKATQDRDAAQIIKHRLHQEDDEFA